MQEIPALLLRWLLPLWPRPRFHLFALFTTHNSFLLFVIPLIHDLDRLWSAGERTPPLPGRKASSSSCPLFVREMDLLWVVLKMILVVLSLLHGHNWLHS